MLFLSARRHLFGAVLVLAVVPLSACSGDPAPAGPPIPEVGAFAQGTCRTAAPDVRAVGSALGRLPTGGQDVGIVAQPVKDSLKQSQDRLFELATAAEPTVKPALDTLIEQLGLVRIRADGNEYAPELGQQLSKDYTALLSACGASG